MVRVTAQPSAGLQQRLCRPISQPRPFPPPGDFPVGGDALPRRERDVPGGAVALAEAALDAAVDEVRGGRAGLKELDVGVGVAVEDHPRVEDKGGVKEALERPHELRGLGAPLHLHERRHVAPRAVLGLEAPAVLGGHDVAHLLHHVAEPLHLLGRPEALAEHQVQVALERVPEARRVVVAVLLEHLDQVHRHVAQLVHGARHVLNQHARAWEGGSQSRT